MTADAPKGYDSWLDYLLDGCPGSIGSGYKSPVELARAELSAMRSKLAEAEKIIAGVHEAVGEAPESDDESLPSMLAEMIGDYKAGYEAAEKAAQLNADDLAAMTIKWQKVRKTTIEECAQAV